MPLDNKTGTPPLNASRPPLHRPTVASAGRCLQGIDLSWLCQTVEAPASFVVTSDDRMIPIALQRELASIMNAPVVELNGGHTMYETNLSAFAVAVAEGISQIAPRCFSHSESMTHAQQESEQS
jgi:hypothetical protein